MLMRFGAVLSAANALEAGLIKSRETAQVKRKARRNGKSGVTGTPSNQGNSQKVELAKLARDLKTAVGTLTEPSTYTGLLKDLAEYGCALLNAGCFAAGTKLWTPDGYRNVEELQVGDLVFSRDESRPDGLVEAKPVEAVFMRFTEVVHLHVAGQLIRTTQEHPFFVHDRGWTPVEKINPGDYILTDTSDWKRIDDVFFTGELETVYNLRIADWHTYFVGDDWGWAAWAHNAYQVGHLEQGNNKSSVWNIDEWHVFKGEPTPGGAMPDRYIRPASGQGPLVVDDRQKAENLARHQRDYEHKAENPPDAGRRFEKSARRRTGGVIRYAELVPYHDGSNVVTEIDFETSSHVYEVGMSFGGKLLDLIRLSIIARLRGKMVIGIAQTVHEGEQQFESYITSLLALTFESPLVQAEAAKMVSNPLSIADAAPLSAYFSGFQFM